MPIRFPLLDRRQFTLGLAGAVLARAGAAGSIYDPKLALHTSIFVADAAARKKRPADILDEALTVIQKAGYRRVELSAEFTRPELRQRAAARLARLGLEPSMLDAAGPMHSAEAAQSCREEAVSLARSFLGRTAFVAFTASAKPDGSRKTDTELDIQAYQLQMLGLELERAGAHLLLDHDAAEMAEDAREWRHMLTHTERGVVSVCLDVEAAVRGGANPWTLIEAAGSRLRSVHLRNTRRGADLEALEDGDIDLMQISKALRERQYDGFLVVDLRRCSAAERQRGLPAALAWSRWKMQETFGSRPGGFPVDMGPHVRFPKKTGTL